MLRKRSRIVLLAVAAVGVIACSGDDKTTSSTTSSSSGFTTSGSGGHGGASSTTGSLSTSSSNSTTGSGLGGQAAFCMGESSIPIPGSTDCLGNQIPLIFAFGICGCTAVQTNGNITVDAFDSSASGMVFSGGSIGSNGPYTAFGNTKMGGALWSLDKTQAGPLDIGNSVHCGGDFQESAFGSTNGDFFEAKNASSPGFTVKGTFHHPAGATATGINASQTSLGAVTVAAPCDCNANIPIPQIIDVYKTTNDDAASMLTPASFEAVQTNGEATLDCGRYYFTKMGITGNLTLHMPGRTAIFIAGDFNLQGGMNFDLGANAELDLFVGGNVILGGNVTLGDPNRPAAIRIYVEGNVQTAGNFKLGANLYAPHGSYAPSGNIDLYGSVLADKVNASGNLNVHYDEAIVKVDGCNNPSGGCNDCHDCSGGTPACKNGTCAACTSDGDCCPPFECDIATGTCHAPVPR